MNPFFKIILAIAFSLASFGVSAQITPVNSKKGSIIGIPEFMFDSSGQVNQAEPVTMKVGEISFPPMNNGIRESSFN